MKGFLALYNWRHESMSDESEKEIETGDLASLDIEAIEGIGGKMATQLNSVKISTIADLEACDPPSVHENAKVSLYKLYELRRKAQMILSVSQALKADEATLKILGENGYSITKTIEEEIPVLQEMTQQTPSHLVSMRDNLLLLLIGLEDHIARRKGSIGLVRKTRGKRPTDSEEPLSEPDTPTLEPDISIPDPDRPLPEPTSRGVIAISEVAKGSLSGGLGGLIAGGIGAAFELHTLTIAVIGAIVGITAWFVLHSLMKD